MPHRTTVTARFSDLDPYNHVNHARYLSYFESARIEALEHIGFSMQTMAKNDIRIVLIELSMSFHHPATLHDLLEIETEVVEVGRATSRWRQRAKLGQDIITKLEIRAAFTDASGRPRRIPDGFAAACYRLNE